MKKNTTSTTNFTGAIDAANVKDLFVKDLPIPINFGPADGSSGNVKFILPGEYETFQQALDADSSDEGCLAGIMEDFDGFKQHILHHNVARLYWDAVVESMIASIEKYHRIVIDIQVDDHEMADYMREYFMYDLQGDQPLQVNSGFILGVISEGDQHIVHLELDFYNSDVSDEC